MRKTRLIAVTTAGALLVAGGALADTHGTTIDSAGSDLTLVHLSGSRDLAVTTVSGGDFTTVNFGTVREAPFLATVTDVMYDQTAYELNASLTNLYAIDPDTLTADCGTDAIASSEISVDFPAVDPVSLTGVSVLAEPVFALSGTITGPLAATLGIPDGTALASEVTGQILNTAQNEVAGAIVTDVTALLESLPLRILKGTGGAFTEPLEHPSCGGGGAETAVGIQSGDLNASFDLVDLIADIFDAVSGDGTLTPDELVTAGIFDDAAVDAAVKDALDAVSPAAGTAAVALGLLDDVRGLVTATVADVSIPTGLLGQSGVYNTVAKLVVDDLPASLPGGTYGGRLEFTLVDKDLS